MGIGVDHCVWVDAKGVDGVEKEEEEDVAGVVAVEVCVGGEVEEMGKMETVEEEMKKVESLEALLVVMQVKVASSEASATELREDDKSRAAGVLTAWP